LAAVMAGAHGEDKVFLVLSLTSVGECVVPLYSS